MDFEDCKNDLKKWDIYFDEGWYYNDKEEKIGRWISLFSHGIDIEFDVDGNYLYTT